MTYEQQAKQSYESLQKALSLACHYQNRCCELEEIVEQFCMDACALRDSALAVAVWNAAIDAAASIPYGCGDDGIYTQIRELKK